MHAPSLASFPFLAGSGAMGALIASHDWSKTSVGPIQSWPAGLKSVLGTILSSPVPLVLLWGEDGVMIYNDAYSDFAGQRHPRLLGSPVLEGWPEVADFNRRVMEVGLAGGTLSFRDQELVLYRNGLPESVWLDLNYNPVMGDDGPAGVLAIVVETTERILAEKALAKSQQRLSVALDAAGMVGTWDWDIRADSLSCDAQFAALFSVDPEVAASGSVLAEYLAAVHPDDVGRVNASIRRCMAEGSKFSEAYRLIQNDGTIRWILARGQCIYGDDGEPMTFPGAAVDITDLKVTEQALAASEDRFRILADTMPQMVWSTLPDGYHDYYNARWYEFTGMPVGSTDGEEWNGMFHPEDQERAWARWQHSLDTGEPYDIEYRLRHHTGQYRWTLGRALPVRDAQGNITRWFGTCTDIHASKMLAEERSLIARELSHRIKNVFSVISGLVGLSARQFPESAPMAEQLRERIQALGRAHDVVRPAGGEGEGTNSLHALLASLFGPYNRDGETVIEVKGADFQVDEAVATPLALLFHELATNAAKYGALSQAGGRVELSVEVSGGRCRMEWKERGGPPVDGEPSRQGLGSRLAHVSIEGQLGGLLHRIWEPDGLRLVADVPMESFSAA